MTHKSIREVFNDLAQELKIDRNWVRKLNRFRIGFTLRNEEHMRFFGGNLFGVEVVRFTINDRDYIFEELLGVEEPVIDNALIKLPSINKDHKVRSDALNNALIWLIYRVLNEPKLTMKEKEQASTDLVHLMNYRFYTSLLSHYFKKYPADPEIATAMYAGLSRKFEIKRLGNWNAVFEERAKDFLARNSIHYKTITSMSDDDKVGYAISDAQGRIRSMFRYLMRELMAASEAKKRIGTESPVFEHEGDQILKDRTKSLRIYGDYLRSVVSDKNAFIKPELIDIIQKAMPSMPPRLFETALMAMVEKAREKNNTEVNELINETLVHAFAYLYQNRQMVRNTSDLSFILTKLRGTYSSSRNTDQRLLELRRKTEEFLKSILTVRHAGNIAATRTGLLLYLVARAMTMKYYSN